MKPAGLAGRNYWYLIALVSTVPGHDGGRGEALLCLHCGLSSRRTLPGGVEDRRRHELQVGRGHAGMCADRLRFLGLFPDRIGTTDDGE